MASAVEPAAAVFDDPIARFVERLAALGGDVADAAERRVAYAALRVRALADAAEFEAARGYRIRLAAERAIADCEARHRVIVPVDPAERSAVWRHVERLPELWTNPGIAGGAAAVLFADTSQRALVPSPGLLRSGARRMRATLGLWLRGMKSDAAGDRIGYVWLLLEPILHVVFITLAALLLHANTVFDMQAYPFAILGVVSWLCFRTSALAAMFNGGPLALQLDHPPLRRFDVILAKSLNGLVVYSLAGLCLMGTAMALDLTGLPENPPQVALSFFGVWLFGLAYGIVAASLQMRYAGVRRVNGLVLRCIALLSGLFYVSEQLPSDFAVWCLWNPLLHLIQFLRSAWFVEYETVDASLSYVLWWLGGSMLLALMCLTIDEKRPRPA